MLSYEARSPRIRGKQGVPFWHIDDAKLEDTSRGIYAVADGITSGKHGYFASDHAIAMVHAECKDLVRGLRSRYPNGQQRVANEEILPYLVQVFTQIKTDVKYMAHVRGLSFLGTTLDVVVVHGDVAYVAHAGDSRVYHYSPADGKVHIITQDHIRRPKGMSDEEFEYRSLVDSKLKNQLGSKVKKLRVDTIEVPLEPGSVIMLATDGVSNNVHSSELEGILGGDSIDEMRDKINELVVAPEHMARWYADWKDISFEQARAQLSGKDDATFILVRGFE